MADPDWLPAFVGGFRSGSTLLINLLGLHPGIAPWFETKAFCEPLRWMRVLREPRLQAFEANLVREPSATAFDPLLVFSRMMADFRATDSRLRGRAPNGKAVHERYPLGFDCVRYSLHEAEVALDRWLAATRACPTGEGIARTTGELISGLGERHTALAGKSHWLNKTPEIPRFGRELRQALGPVRVILMVRHGHEVAASARELGWASVEDLATWWRFLIELSRESSAEAPSHYLEVRYEDLVSRPEQSLNHVLSFIELDGSGAKLVDEYRRRMGGNVFRRVVRKESRTLSETDREAFEEKAGTLMRELGYR